MKTENQKLWPVLLTTMFASFMNPFMIAAVNIGLPDIQGHFNCNATTLSWITNSFLLANAMVLLPFSKAADNWGRNLFFKIGLYVFTLFTLLAAFSPSIEILLLLRVLQGAGAALMHVTAVAILTETYPPKQRGVVLGINIGAVYAGLSLGPFIGGLLTQIGGWQLIFLSVVPTGLISIILSHLNLKNNIRQSSIKPFDFVGSIIYALAIFAFIYGGGKIKSLYGLIIFISGLALTAYFFIYEKKIDKPILNVVLLKNNKRFTYSNLAALIHYSSTFGVGFLLSLHLQYAKGLSPRSAGMILVIQPIIMAITAPLTGRLSDKINAGYIASLGMLVTFFSLALFLFLNTETSVLLIVINLAILGLGFGLFTSPNTNAIMSSVEHKDLGLASGINATMRVFGQTISMMMATIFISIYLNKTMLSANTANMFIKSMNLYFIFFSLLCLLGVGFSIQRHKP